MKLISMEVPKVEMYVKLISMEVPKVHEAYIYGCVKPSLYFLAAVSNISWVKKC